MSNNIKKFAKFGIVLVAAITVATAAQSQGVVTQHVYAEEVTNESNYNDYRMFYVYSAIYPNSPNDGSMAGRVIKPDDPYVVDENFRKPGTYDHYDVFDDTGKHYNVGDVITVDDPLVNHPNEEDNRLYYYYYPLTPSTSETPGTSTSPSTSESPAPSVSPSTSESPNTSETPGTSTSPSTSESPAVEKPSQKADDKTTATDKAKDAKANKADSKPAKADKSKDANSKKAAATKDNSVANKAAEKSNATSALTEQAKDTTAKTNNPDTGNSQSIVKEAAGTVDTAAVNHNDNNGFLATLLVSVAAALIGLFQYKKQPKKEK